MSWSGKMNLEHVDSMRGAIVCEPSWGAHVKIFLAEVKEVAAEAEGLWIARFNEVLLLVKADSDLDELVQRYDAQRNRLGRRKRPEAQDGLEG